MYGKHAGTVHDANAELQGHVAVLARKAAGSANAVVAVPYKAPASQTQAFLTCPLTKEIMREPVIAADGYTYERHAIDAWLQHHNVSPVTGKHLTHKLLVDNTVIKSLIQQQRA